ncbi:putative glutamate carboxypeptidase LAMP1 [Metarhizium anisopliae]
MPSDEKTPFYDPVPPTYDEALASGSRRGYDWGHTRSSIDNRDADEAEQQSLLRQPETAAGPSRQPPRGYRPPTVETDDEFSLLGSDSELDSDEEAAQIRREMQEMEVEEPSTSIGSVWSKRIGFSLSLPKWKWSWRPRLPRFRIQLPSRATEPTRNENEAETETSTDTRRQWPRMNSMAMIIVFARLVALLIVLGFIYFLFATGFFSGFSTRLPGGLRFDPEDLKAFLQSNVDPMRMRASVLHYSHYAHIAGTEGDYAMAMDVESMFHRAGLESGPLIYANYGSRDDFQKLQDKGIDTKGAIALVRQMGTQKDVALKVKAAELAGFAGCLIYSDPAENGFVKGDVAPKGRWMPEDGVQRGSVSLKNMGVGDVLTPGWESKKEKQRMAVEDAPGLVKIPSLPLAWRDAKILLQQIKGYGQQVPDGWKGSVPEVDEWWTGDHSSPVVRLQNEQDEIEKQPVWNVYGKILGMEQTSNSIILGNHRDSMAFGASQPHSGTAVMIELARIFGNLLSRGWRPLRTIEFMSWDAAEYNMAGSTEYVEMNLDTLRQNAYAYINLDAAITGTQFTAAGSPPLDRALIRALERVVDPFKNETLKYQWDSRKATLQGLGGGGDYVPFQDIAGTSSIDLKFEGEPVPFGSSYESFNLVEQVIDPNFIYHGLMGQVVGLLLLDLADRAIMPFDMVGYARSLNHWVHDLEYWVNKQKTAKDGASKIPFQELKDAVELVKSNAEEFEKWELEWDRSILSSGGYEANGLGTQRINYNDRMAAFEASLLDLELGGGIPNRTQFKHVVFGPQLWSTYDASFFPAIRDTVEASDWELARLLTTKTAALLRKAATILQM